MSTAMILLTRSTGSAETQMLGEALGRLLRGREVVELRSDLGGGKTTFVRGLVRGAGSKNTVASPTFVVNKIYKARVGEIHHFDFYRLSDPGVLADQLRESLENAKVITVVEWGRIVEGVLPKERLVIRLEPTASSTDERDITIEYPENKTQLINQLQNNWMTLKP